MAQRTRIAIFECDDTLDPDRSAYGGYGGLVSAWLNSHPRLQEQAEVRVWDTKHAMQYPEPEEYDVILITGAPTHPTSQETWVVKLVSYLKAAVSAENNKKFVGICFGHQVLALAYGLSVGKNPEGYENAVTEVQLSATGRDLFKQDTISLNQSHSWIVKGVEGEIQNTGSTKNTAVQGLYLADRLWSLQAHPEFDRAAMEKVLELTRPEITGQEYQDAVARNTGDAEQDVALESLANFVLA
ncbi:class I glutamine amidotransferase-like protein [Ilyonectria robusta]|uniref:class I glutamine amidotransferase-like protein n=1 Tax=Ilyonectria robusta TaxID=1079257 RepID=UPI001E8D9327|nr:class I glutamine amidotransferase-like protein [Ilyonectria robusta]KAH8672283.1 class I glutamine amidotransferase-like protein [Ilyonectria robusta]